MRWICRWCWLFNPTKISMDEERLIASMDDEKIRKTCIEGICGFSNTVARPTQKCWNWIHWSTMGDVWATFGKDESYSEITDLSPSAKKRREKELFRKVVDNSEQVVLGV